jgi:hypothetical protein
VTFLVVALALAAPPQPKLDWSLFPEGTTELRHDTYYRKRGEHVVTVYRVTRAGAKTVLEVDRHELGRRGVLAPSDAGDGTVTRFEAAGPGDPAVSSTSEQRSLRCVK